MVRINERGQQEPGEGHWEDTATDQSRTGTFHCGEDGVSQAGDGLGTGSSVLAPDGNVHRNTTGALF